MGEDFAYRGPQYICSGCAMEIRRPLPAMCPACSTRLLHICGASKSCRDKEGLLIAFSADVDVCARCWKAPTVCEDFDNRCDICVRRTCRACSLVNTGNRSQCIACSQPLPGAKSTKPQQTTLDKFWKSERGPPQRDLFALVALKHSAGRTTHAPALAFHPVASEEARAGDDAAATGSFRSGGKESGAEGAPAPTRGAPVAPPRAPPRASPTHGLALPKPGLKNEPPLALEEEGTLEPRQGAVVLRNHHGVAGDAVSREGHVPGNAGAGAPNPLGNGSDPSHGQRPERRRPLGRSDTMMTSGVHRRTGPATGFATVRADTGPPKGTPTVPPQRQAAQPRSKAWRTVVQGVRMAQALPGFQPVSQPLPQALQMPSRHLGSARPQPAGGVHRQLQTLGPTNARPSPLQLMGMGHSQALHTSPIPPQEDWKVDALVNAFTQTLLNWSPGQIKAGDAPLPPHVKPPSPVPNTFSSNDAYRAAFEPLLYEEAKASLQQGMEQLPSVNASTLLGMEVTRLGDFAVVAELKPVIGDEDNEGDRLRKAREKACEFVDDMVVVVYGQDDRRCFAVVSSPEKKVPAPKEPVVCLKLPTSFGYSIGAVKNKKIVVKVVDNMVTLYRELRALYSLPSLPLSPPIRVPRLVPVAPTGDLRPQEVSTLRCVSRALNLNASQEGAVRAVLRDAHAALGDRPQPRITLVQGPPGTGKTTTIVAMCSALLMHLKDGGHAAKRLLLCAPSNAAVDEAATRIITVGLVGKDGAKMPTSLVRVGKTESPLVKPFAIGSRPEDDESPQLARLRAERERLDADRRKYGQSLDERERSPSPVPTPISAVGPSPLERCAAAVERSVETTKPIPRSLAEQSKRELTKAKHEAANQRKAVDAQIVSTAAHLRVEHVCKADVICSTLSSSAAEMLTSVIRSKHRAGSGQAFFPVVVIDEAAQAVELSSLIPLNYGAQHVVLVGDPMQLPATVLSMTAKRHLYAEGLFQRCVRAGMRPHVLAEQYRMHPVIAQFVSMRFYDGVITNAVSSDARTAPYHDSVNGLLGPLAVHDVTEGREEEVATSKSFCNRTEVAHVLRIIRLLYGRWPELFRERAASAASAEDGFALVGVVAPYRAQVKALNDAIRHAEDLKEVAEAISIATVDGFQGREVDVLIYSATRSGGPSIGHVRDVHRLNVAVTRARRSLIVVASVSTLRSNDDFAALFDHARDHGIISPASALPDPTPPVPAAPPPRARQTSKAQDSDAKRRRPDADPRSGMDAEAREHREEARPLKAARQNQTPLRSPSDWRGPRRRAPAAHTSARDDHNRTSLD